MISSDQRDGSRLRHPSVVERSPQSFAHSSERLFSQLLTLYGHDWLYEPLEFPLEWNDRGIPTRGFRPDFYLPAQQVFIELTVLEQRLVTKKNRKVRLFRELYPEVPLVIIYQRDFLKLLESHSLRDYDKAA